MADEVVIPVVSAPVEKPKKAPSLDDLVRLVVKTIGDLSPFKLYDIGGQVVFKIPFDEPVGTRIERKYKYLIYLITKVRGEHFKYSFEIPENATLEVIEGSLRNAMFQFENWLFKPQDEIKSRVS